ncbi:YhcN/YlaJ family sporulation lipoprotein [Pseudalkalibacillus decolorationis]|uniref:YhcN/YlaJ family sporulation lipoprotein n=1 Tax=Pseudalkalibacillus decolorationis TaxID=163879 RepID=UPI002147D6D2|nr:YhcN/YlaJ family sporulation lipoprotein [Pseudalkalibacillus decolorationis]
MEVNVKWPKFGLSLLVVLGLVSGCTGNENGSEQENANVTKIHTKQEVDQSIANESREKVIKIKEVTDVRAVNTNKELLVAIKVDNFDRFQLKEIEKKVKTNLKKSYPDHKIEVSTDQKMFFELEKLEGKLHNQKMKKQSLQKELDRIKALMKEQP